MGLHWRIGIGTIIIARDFGAPGTLRCIGNFMVFDCVFGLVIFLFRLRFWSIFQGREGHWQRQLAFFQWAWRGQGGWAAFGGSHGVIIAVFIACVPLRLITLPSLLHCAYAFPWLMMHAVRRARQQRLVALVVSSFQYLHGFTGESKRLRPPMSNSSCQSIVHARARVGISIVSTFQHFKISRFPLLHTDPRFVKVEILNKVLQSWNLEMLNYFKNMSTLKSWNVEDVSIEMLKCWNISTLKCWTLEILQSWNLGMLKCWNLEMLKCWNVQIHEEMNWHIFKIWRFQDFRNSTFPDFKISTFQDVNISRFQHVSICSAFQHLKISRFPLLHTDPRFVKVEILKHILQSWNLEMLKYFKTISTLKSWSVEELNLDMLKCWFVSTLKCWNRERLKPWNLEVLKCWNVEILKSWSLAMCWGSC